MDKDKIDFKERINYVIENEVYIGTCVNLPIVIQAESLDDLNNKAKEISKSYLKLLTDTLNSGEPFELVKVDKL